MPDFRWQTFVLIISLLLCSVLGAAAAEVRGRVSWIYDGDTIKVDGVGKVRLLGIDTPERKASERDKSFRRAGIAPKQLRRGAKQATDFLIRTAKGQVVTLTFDRERRDHYGRTLAYVTLTDGRLLNRELLREGLACVYRRFDFRMKDDFIRVEAAARAGGHGLWSQE
ncbi:MAG: thermonuclease [Deltaproteobacteria bacterium HGW-Deltaproteobacteria-4]|nr:MAG: thermonuclease [Deltaproteobacteria bacterium HGW-Deltaproteobacteria-4]